MIYNKRSKKKKKRKKRETNVDKTVNIIVENVRANIISTSRKGIFFFFFFSLNIKLAFDDVTNMHFFSRQSFCFF